MVSKVVAKRIASFAITTGVPEQDAEQLVETALAGTSPSSARFYASTMKRYLDFVEQVGGDAQHPTDALLRRYREERDTTLGLAPMRRLYHAVREHGGKVEIPAILAPHSYCQVA